jgi:hypothetical protein
MGLRIIMLLLPRHNEFTSLRQLAYPHCPSVRSTRRGQRRAKERFYVTIQISGKLRSVFTLAFALCREVASENPFRKGGYRTSYILSSAAFSLSLGAAT